MYFPLLISNRSRFLTSILHSTIFSVTVELHHDRCDITANLALSRSDTYVGGGTTIAAIGQVVRLELGEVLLHPGSMVHGGNPITAGTRYLMVTFADLKR